MEQVIFVRAHSEPSVSGDFCKPSQQLVVTDRTQVFKPSLNLSF